MVEPIQTNEHPSLQRKVLVSAIALAIGTTALPQPSMADQYVFSYGNSEATFTVLTSTGASLLNPDRSGAPWYSGRTAISGTLSFDTATDTGSMTMSSFSFFGGGAASTTGVALAGIGDGFGNPGTLMLGNMSFVWSGSFGIPLSIVMDARGLSDAINLNEDGNPANNLNTTTNNQVTGGVLSATETTTFGTPMNNYILPLGPSPLVTTTWNTSNFGNPTLGSNPSGTLPLIADTVAGSPFQQATPFNDFNGTFDFQRFVLTSYTDTTPPVLTLNGSNELNLNAGDTYVEPGATCVDAHDGNLTPVIGSSVNTSVPGTYVLTYNCMDAAGNAAPQQARIINVLDGTHPLITLLGSDPVSHEVSTPYSDAGATCVDLHETTIGDGLGDGAIGPLNGIFTPPQDFSSISTVDPNVLGSYTVTYNCSDSDGHVAAPVTRVVNVQDGPPLITLTPDCTSGIVINAGEPDPTPTATASDVFDGDLTAAIISGGDVVNPTPTFAADELSQVFNPTWSVTDSAGNTTNANCQITVGNPVPVITLNGASTIFVDLGGSFTDPGAFCQDFTDGLLPDAIADSAADTNVVGSQTINYLCVDSVGNTASTSRTVTVSNGSEIFVSGNGVVGSAPGIIAQNAGSTSGKINETALYSAGIPIDNQLSATCGADCLDLDIDISGDPGSEATIILSLNQTLEALSHVRLYNTTTFEWNDFAIAGLDTLSSTVPTPLGCPGPTDTSYQPGLVDGDTCVKIVLSDDGPNDNAPILGTINLIGGVGVKYPDTDLDGLLDNADNCLEKVNIDQRDTNSDGFGNLCDPDLNNDGVVNFVDLGALRSVFFTADPDADLNGDGVVNFVDLGIMKSMFFNSPGPSGLVESSVSSQSQAATTSGVNNAINNSLKR